MMGCMSSKISPDFEDKPKEATKGLLLRGDVATKVESRNEREKKMKEKQIRITSAAEELCGRILEEKERLSINSRSRETSVNTSRVTSPSGERKKHVQFRKDEKMDKLKEKSAASLNESRERIVVNGSVASSSGVHPVISVQPSQGETSPRDDKPSKSKSSLKDSKSG
ncbi:uncharacterized protein LOC121384530 [Gigantopelta aegis]|uniref:uncharacterized protein LOC121384530 n=1 Tax=Gigantopelta aegis TaxID=1735272 RepID=UPI001B88E2AB|nr:uncharacterized protein LOC121384530 [Gigantopelta aegis]